MKNSSQSRQIAHTVGERMAIGSFDRSGAVGQVVLTVLFSGERAGGEGVVRPEGDGREGGEARAGHCGNHGIALNQLQSEPTQIT